MTERLREARRDATVEIDWRQSHSSSPRQRPLLGIETRRNKFHERATIPSSTGLNPGYNQHHQRRLDPAPVSEPLPPKPLRGPLPGSSRFFFEPRFRVRDPLGNLISLIEPTFADTLISTRSGPCSAANSDNINHVASGSGPRGQALELTAPQPPGANRGGRSQRQHNPGRAAARSTLPSPQSCGSAGFVAGLFRVCQGLLISPPSRP